MPWEHIGNCGTGQIPEDTEWIDFCYETAIAYIKLALGDPPAGCELDVMWSDHELGSYPSVGLYWDFPADDAPWNYLNRAEELLERLNAAVDWSQLHPFPLNEEEGGSEEEEDNADEALPDNPSPLSLNYYTYKEVPFSCEHCGWTGNGGDLEHGDMFGTLFELDCPACHEMLTFISYPTTTEARANWDKLSEVDQMQVEIIERRLDLFEQVSLKSPEQLPNIDEPEFLLLWDYVEIPKVGGTTIIRLGERQIFAEPAFYEGYERFMNVAEILKTKYGNALMDLVPTNASELYLYGDSISSPRKIENCRMRLFGLISESPPVQRPASAP
jgi:hypothetical protein